MNCKPSDLAIVVVPADFPRKTLDGKVVKVIRFVPPRGAGEEWDQRPTWWCAFQTAWFNDHGRMFVEGPMLDSWLRPISGVPVNDDEPASVNMPEAFQLALGIEMRAWA